MTSAVTPLAPLGIQADAQETCSGLLDAQELETAVGQHIPVLVVIVNNNCGGRRFPREGGGYGSGDLGNPVFGHLARLSGLKGITQIMPISLRAFSVSGLSKPGP